MKPALLSVVVSQQEQLVTTSTRGTSSAIRVDGVIGGVGRYKRNLLPLKGKDLLFSLEKIYREAYSC